jgi:hypothetical protein
MKSLVIPINVNGNKKKFEYFIEAKETENPVKAHHFFN